ncbi:hypothetical protein [Breoghania sp.]|uniref:hypothetical protein n=1 Tax=Breoghania sp. TaxID=2065378 RepID=UPI00261AA1D9|nr:hypothetical protein [Breoghania sp.]MDJ0933144.1 hypothetical protein [Breoghania sp.]
MPTLTRYIFVLLVLGGLGYAAVWALANKVEPTPHEITIRLPSDKIDQADH